MRRTREQMLAELQAKIAEDKKRGEARETTKAIAAALAKRDYSTAHTHAQVLLELSAALLHDTRGMEHLGAVGEVGNDVPY